MACAAIIHERIDSAIENILGTAARTISPLGTMTIYD
jgi:hypothetical protein